MPAPFRTTPDKPEGTGESIDHRKDAATPTPVVGSTASYDHEGVPRPSKSTMGPRGRT